VHWTLASSDAVKTTINQQYKNRHDDDLNIPLSVQPWGSDGDKRRYFLVEGNDDTSFRVYRESNPAGINRTWWNVAGSIDDLRVLSEKLEKQDGGPKAKTFAKRILNSVPRFEATEEKRRRREYRQMRKEQFRRPEPGFSLYEGRTRGKRMKYTYSDDEADFFSDSTGARRSTRNTRHHTPAEPSGPVTTASGRQVRAPNRLNVENASNDGPSSSAPTSVQGDGDGDSEMKGGITRTGRPQRNAAANHGMNGWASTKKRKSEEYESDESEESSNSGPDFEGGEEDDHVPDESDEEEEEFDEEVEEELVDDDDLDDGPNWSLMFKFPIRVSFDENDQVRQIPGPPVVVDRQKHSRTTKRMVVLSDESESSDAGQEANVEPEPPAAEEISVATKRMTPVESADKPGFGAGVARPVDTAEKVEADADKVMADADAAVKSPPTPSSETATSLALRGSPEVSRSVARPVDVGF
jgi:hypothetical protein